MSDELILLGQIGAAHGIRGEVRIKSFTQDPLNITTYGTLETNRDGLVIEIEGARLFKSMVIARLKKISDRNQAERLKGTKLFAPRRLIQEQLEDEDEDDYLQADLIGLRAQDANGKGYGVIKAIQNYGGGDILEILPPSGASVLYPFTKQAVIEVKIAAGHIIIDPPLGLFDDGEAKPQ